MMALDRRVFEPVWEAVRELLPVRPPDRHPLGCHRPRVSDRTCLFGIVARLVTGCSWVTAGHLVGVAATTLRRRRDEWLRAEVFSRLVTDALEAYDHVIGVDPTGILIDTSLHKAPMGGSGTGPSRVDRAKLGWKCSLCTDAHGCPIGWVPAAANIHDQKLVDDTLDTIDARGYEIEVQRADLDRGYDAVAVREIFTESGIDAHIAHRAKPKIGRKARRRPSNPEPLGRRWRVERTNSWLSNFGQLRRSTDRHIIHREAALDLAVTFTLATKLVKWHQHHGATIYIQ
jgi:transposase